MMMATQFDREILTDIRRAVEAAENAGDVDYIAGLFAGDAVLMVPDFPVQEGRTACADFIRSLLPGLLSAFDRRVTYTSAEVSVLGEMALDRGSFSFTVRPKGSRATECVTGKYLWLYEQEDGTWKWSRIILSRDEPEEHSTAKRHPPSAAHPRPGWGMGLLAGVAVAALASGLATAGRRRTVGDNDIVRDPDRQ